MCLLGFFLESSKFSPYKEIPCFAASKLIFPFNHFDITALEYKPFTRFTIAKSLDDLTLNKLSKLMNSIIRDRNSGCFIVEPETINTKIDDIFLVKLSTAISHLI